MALPEKRWIQRLDNYKKAFAVLDNAHALDYVGEMKKLLETMKKYESNEEE